MAGNHCHHHHHCEQQCCCCYCYCCSTSSFIPPPSPPATTVDPALLTIASYLAASLQKPQSSAITLSPPQLKADPLALEPILGRISALESALRRLSLIPTSQSPPPPPAGAIPPLPHAKSTPIRTPRTSYTNFMANSLRDHAARIIQAHFRSFLSRRSQMLRHLKLIAFAQTFLNNLRLRLSDQAQLLLLSQKQETRLELVERTADLLARIDAIRTGESMIRDAKRSVSRDLAGVLDVLNGSSCTNSRTRRWVASESNDGGTEKVRRHFSHDQSFNHDMREDAGFEREDGFIRLGKDGKFCPNIGGRDGTELKSRVNNVAPNVKKNCGDP